MNSVHRIRLRGLWELESSSAGAGSVRKVRLPADFCDLFEGQSGKVWLARRFHCPTNLGPADEVAVVVGKLPGPCNVTLNGCTVTRELSQQSESRFVVTPYLKPNNLLRLEIEVDAAAGADSADRICGEIALEIRPGASD